MFRIVNLKLSELVLRPRRKGSVSLRYAPGSMAEYGVNHRYEAWEAETPIFLRLAWAGPEGRPLGVPDLVDALWNAELLYDFSLLMTHPDYQHFDFDHWTEDDVYIKPQHRMQVVSVEHHSPLGFLALIPIAAAGAGGIWAITQTFEKIANFRLNRSLRSTA